MHAHVKWRYLEYVAFALIALVISYQILIPPVIGVADNGDFNRVMGRFGLRAVPPTEEDRYFFYVNRTFTLDPNVPFSWKALFRGFISSETLLLATALGVHHVIGRNAGYFDLRILGAIHLILYLCAIGLVMHAVRRHPPPVRLALAGLLAIIFADGAYVAYFNSIYSEPAAICFLSLLIAAAIVWIENPSSRWAMVLLAVSGLLLSSAKQPYAVFGFVTLGVGIPLAAAVSCRRIALLLVAASFLGSMIYIANKIPDDMRWCYQYNIVFAEILKTSPAVETDLQSLGLEPELAKYAGTYAYKPGIDFMSPYFQQHFHSRFSYIQVLRFYLRHPGRALRLAQMAIQDGFLVTPLQLGMMEKAPGVPPRSQAYAVRLWSDWKSAGARIAVLLMSVFVILNAAAACWTRWHSTDRRVKRYCELHLWLLIMAALQVPINIFSQGHIDLQRRMFLFSLIVDVILGIDVTYVVSVIYAHKMKRAPRLAEPAPSVH